MTAPEQRRPCVERRRAGRSFDLARAMAEIVRTDDETALATKGYLHDARGTFCTDLLTPADPNAEEAEGATGPDARSRCGNSARIR